MKLLHEVEYSSYSQNGEDGIIRYLLDRVEWSGCEGFMEIGCHTGEENNTTNLAEQGWRGVVFDAKSKWINQYKKRGYHKVQAYTLEVTPFNHDVVLRIWDCAFNNSGVHPVFFSIDIDSYDLHVVNSLLKQGFRPAIVCAEYNATFGDKPIAVPYHKRPYKRTQEQKFLYFGAGVQAWKYIMHKRGYKFVTVDSSGTNCFFVLKDKIKDTIDLLGKDWAENQGQLVRFGPQEERIKTLEGMYLRTVQFMDRKQMI